MALLDISNMEKLDDGDGLRATLVAIGDGAARHTSLRVVSRKDLLLNDVVPSLHRMALRTGVVRKQSDRNGTTGPH